MHTVESSRLNNGYSNRTQNRSSEKGERVLEKNTTIYYTDLAGELTKYYIKHDNGALEEISEQFVQNYLRNQPDLNIDSQLQKLFSITESPGN